MSFISVASINSCCKGYEYYLVKKVVRYKEIGKGIYSGVVKGSDDNIYNVEIDIKHPRKSKCDCPFANGRRLVCKHAVALYFTIFPDEAKAFKEEYDRGFIEYEKYQEEVYNKLIRYIDKMTKSELKDELLLLLNDCPDWIYDRFVNEHLDDL